MVPGTAAGCVWDGHCSLTPTPQRSHCKQGQPVHLSRENEQGPQHTNQIKGRPIFTSRGTEGWQRYSGKFPRFQRGKGVTANTAVTLLLQHVPNFPSYLHEGGWGRGKPRQTQPSEGSRGGSRRCPHRPTEPLGHSERPWGKQRPKKGHKLPGKCSQLRLTCQ